MHHTSAGSLLPCPKPVARNNRVIPRARRIGNQLIPGSCCPQAAPSAPTFSSLGEVGVEKLKSTNVDERRGRVSAHTVDHLSGALSFELGDSNPRGPVLGHGWGWSFCRSCPALSCFPEWILSYSCPSAMPIRYMRCLPNLLLSRGLVNMSAAFSSVGTYPT